MLISLICMTLGPFSFPVFSLIRIEWAETPSECLERGSSQSLITHPSPKGNNKIETVRKEGSFFFCKRLPIDLQEGLSIDVSGSRKIKLRMPGFLNPENISERSRFSKSSQITQAQFNFKWDPILEAVWVSFLNVGYLLRRYAYRFETEFSFGNIQHSKYGMIYYKIESDSDFSFLAMSLVYFKKRKEVVVTWEIMDGKEICPAQWNTYVHISLKEYLAIHCSPYSEYKIVYLLRL